MFLVNEEALQYINAVEYRANTVLWNASIIILSGREKEKS